MDEQGNGFTFEQLALSNRATALTLGPQRKILLSLSVVRQILMYENLVDTNNSDTLVTYFPESVDRLQRKYSRPGMSNTQLFYIVRLFY
jgi:hypothetical protein